MLALEIKVAIEIDTKYSVAYWPNLRKVVELLHVIASLKEMHTPSAAIRSLLRYIMMHVKFN